MVNKINISQSTHGTSSSFFSSVPHLPLVGGIIGFSAQGIGLIFRSKLLLVSISMAAIILGGLGYIATHKSLVVHQPEIQAGSTSSKSSGASAQNQTADTTSTTGSSTSTTAKPSTPSSTKSAPASGTTPSSPSAPAAPTTPTPPSTPIAPSGSCFAAPSACGYPDASNTGPLAGTVFTRVPEDATSGSGWNWDSTYEYISVYGSNVTLNGIVTSGGIDITGSNVTLQNCKITQNNGMFGVSIRHSTNVTVKNCNIAGTNAGAGRLMVGIKSIYDDDVNLRSIANNVSYVSTGIQYCQGTIQDNYIHDMGYQSGDHLNGTTSNAGCNQLTIQHNTIFNNFDQTDAVSLFEDFGGQANALITNNLLAGGGYTIYGGANAGGATPTNIQITNNRISDHYYANGGYYGWLAAWNGAGAGNVCSGNILEHSSTGSTQALGC